jgi:hypothetical protein
VKSVLQNYFFAFLALVAVGSYAATWLAPDGAEGVVSPVVASSDASPPASAAPAPTSTSEALVTARAPRPRD